jgi:DNA-binding winged helix-turn-helix (wHTH) protein
MRRRGEPAAESRGKAVGPARNSSFMVGDCEIFVDLHRLRRGDELLEIEPRAMAVLAELARVPGRVVTYDDLFRTVWHDVIVTDDALYRCITQLRRVFGDDPRSPRFIETISKRGYRLIAPVVHLSDEAPSSGAPQPAGYGDPDLTLSLTVVARNLLGHRAVIAVDVDEETWRETVREVAARLGAGAGTTVWREDVAIRAEPDANHRRFNVRTRVLGAATPAGTALVTFALAGMLLYGRTLQAGHAVALGLAGAVAGWLFGMPARRRALERSHAAIAGFEKLVRWIPTTARRSAGAGGMVPPEGA